MFTGLTLSDQWTWKISPTAELIQKFDLNSDVSGLSNFFFRLEVNLSAALTNKIAIKLSFIDSYDNSPQGDDIKKNDMAFLTGLSYKF